jgi:anti-anti-sigma factor
MESILEVPNKRARAAAPRTVVRFTGSGVCLDQETVEDIRHQLLGLADTPGTPDLVLDFAKVEYISSLLLGTLVTLHKRLAIVGRQMTLCNLGPLVHEVFTTTRLDRFLKVQGQGWLEETEPAPNPDDSPCGVLVAGEDADANQRLSAALGDRGFRAWLADGGHQAVELFRRYRRDIRVVLLDALMSGLNGPDTLGAIRRLSDSVRCCFMIGSTHPITNSTLLRQGAIRVFRKPLAVAEVVAAIDQLARRLSQCGQVYWIEIPNPGE